MTQGSNISARLARHIASLRYEDLSAQTVANTKRALLDGLGVILAASGLSDDVKPFVQLARSMRDEHGASILGSWERVSPSAAALANGAMAHALDFEDALDTAAAHPNAALIPAALAIAESHREISGPEFLTAMAIGCDLTCRIALSVGQAVERSPWYPPPIFGAFGAAAAAAKLLKVNESQINDVFSLMLCQTACPGEIKHSKDTVIRAVREAFPAQAAVTSVLLAAQGVRGFDEPFEGRAGFYRMFANGECDEALLLGDLGQRFYIDELSFKPWPCCRGTHPYVEAAQQLRSRHSINWREIRTIKAGIGSVQRMLSEPLERKRAPATSIDAKFSVPFTIATALIRPEVTLDDFSAERLRDADTLSVASKVVCEFRGDDVSATSGTVAIELNDGRIWSCEIPEALGHPSRRLDDSRLRAKFIDCAGRAARSMSEDEASAFADRIMRIETATSFAASISFPA